jgi:F-type H+-transporting ATPase subunit b
MNLTPDSSLFSQIVLFIALWAVLKRLVFDPVFAVLDARQQRTVGTQAAANALTAEVDGFRGQHAQALQTARGETGQQAEAARKGAQDEHERIVAEARAAAATQLTQARAALTAQVDAARRTLAAEAEAVAAEMLRQASGGRG